MKQRASSTVAAGALCGLGLGVFDLAMGGLTPPSRAAAMLSLFGAGGAAAAVGLLLLASPLRRISPARRFSWSRLLCALYIGGLALFTARYALRAPIMSGAPGGARFHGGLLVCSSSIAAVAYAALPLAVRTHGASWRLGLAAFGAAAIAVDRLVLVSLYERAHTIAEAMGFALLTAALATTMTTLRARRASVVVAVAGLVWLLSLGASSQLRVSLDASLPHNAKEQRVYLARLVRHVRVLEAVARGGSPELPSGAHHLAARYEIHDTRLDEAWTSPASRTASAFAQSEGHPWNVIFFFVDTLRADVASDETTMPATARWMRDHVSFSRAYAPASSTLLSLAPLLSCRYDAKPDDSPALLRLARERGMTRTLFIPQRASGYHRTFFPSFRFDHEEVVNDADGSVLLTGDVLVERALAWLGDHRSTPFFLWLYDFDVHEWPLLSQRALEDIAQKGGLSKTSGLPWRYRAAARAVDGSFERLRAGLRDLGLLDRTVIVFLADHGEGLGEHGQWAHSTYLWETLVRVPLGVEAPGLVPRRIDTPVSLVDLPTTLSRFIGPVADEERCHGEDALADEVAPRRLPILLSAMFEGSLVRVGLLDDSEKKLIVDLREGHARLYDLPSEEESSSHPPAEAARLLDRLVRSPLYPRP